MKAYDTGESFTQTTPGQTVNGTASNTAGDPISNATIQLTISKKPSLPQADEQLETLSNPIPEVYQEQLDGGFQLRGDDGYLANNEGQYAAVYSVADLGLTHKQSADLRSPKVTNVEPGEQQALVIGDTEADCGVFGFNTNEYNGQVPGCLQTEGNVTIEKLSATGEVVSSDQAEISEHNRADYPGVTEIHYATYTFSTGIYRIVPDDEDGVPYYIKAGTPTPDFNEYARTVTGERTAQAQEMVDAQAAGTLEVKTVPTNETGYWEASVPSDATMIAVSARKAPGVDVDPKNLTHENMSEAYNSETPPNASVYLPSSTKQVQPGASDVHLTLREVAFPSFANIDRLQNRIEELRNKLNNLSMDDLPQQLLQRLETESNEDLRQTWSSMRGTLTNFEPAKEQYLEISDRDSVPKADELSNSELQAAIRNANLAITRTASTASVSETASETTQDTISRTWELSGIDVDEANISVVADYSNGTSRVLTDEYVEVDSQIGRPDTITVNEYPMGEDDPEQMELRLRIAGNNELAETSSTVMNPTFSGEAPRLDAVEVTSLAPGPDDEVTVELHPEADSSFKEMTSMTVYGPSGDELETTNISDGRKASFTTNGEGTHSIRFTVESTGGGTFTDVIQLSAAGSDETLRPSIYAHSGPMGKYALVGDGFESGDVDTSSTGALEITGELDGDAEAPNTVDVFTEGVELSAETPTTVRVVRGEDRESVRKNIPVIVHGPMLNGPEDSQESKALVMVNGGNPVTWDGDTRYGHIEQDDDGSSIHAYTADNGELTYTVNNNPGWWDQQSFSLRLQAPWLYGLSFAGGGTGLLAGFVLVRRRRATN